MTRPQLTVAEVIRSCLDEFLERFGPKLTPEQRRALKDLTASSHGGPGGHVLGCSECGYRQIAYNSCGNRYVAPPARLPPRHGGWRPRAAELLPVPYFHIVFTLPNALDPPEHWATRESVTTCSAARPPRPCLRWPPIPSSSVPGPVCWLCCTPGG